MLAGYSQERTARLVEIDDADDLFVKLAAGMIKPTITYRKDGTIRTITLPDGIEWPDLKSSVLYVRSIVSDLWNSVLNRCERRKEPRLDAAVILGTPGSTWHVCSNMLAGQECPSKMQT